MRTTDRGARATVAVLAAALALMTVIGPVAAAGPPQPVTIVSPITNVSDGYNYGSFTATGSGFICGSGDVLDTRYVWTPSWRDPSGVQLLVDKTFTCPDGLIFFRLKVHGVSVSETFNWVILGGTGAYAGLHGEGQGTTDNEETPTNTYTGFLN